MSAANYVSTFCGGWVEPDLVALPVGLRFYVSRGMGVSKRDVVALSASDYVSTFRGDDLGARARLVVGCRYGSQYLALLGALGVFVGLAPPPAGSAD